MKKTLTEARFQFLAGVINENEAIPSKLFRVYGVNESGKLSYYVGVFKASSEEEARETAAKMYNNKEISDTGFYGAQEVNASQLAKEREEALKKVDDMTKIMN
jgi:hypothetical protein